MLKSKIADNVGFNTPNPDITKNTKGRRRAEEQEEITMYISKTDVLFLTEVFFFTSWLKPGERISLQNFPAKREDCFDIIILIDECTANEGPVRIQYFHLQSVILQFGNFYVGHLCELLVQPQERRGGKGTVANPWEYSK
jgi:hypothetical protein